jgi:hypothetical protein
MQGQVVDLGSGAGGYRPTSADCHDGSGDFTIPRGPLRRCLPGMPRFVVARGGEYCFMPSLPALGGGFMNALQLLFNAITVIFIATTMFAAGLGTTLSALRAVFTDLPLLLPAVLANLVVVPLLGWGIAALFGLLGSWRDVVALLGSRTLLAGFVLSVVAFAVRHAAGHRTAHAPYHHGRHSGRNRDDGTA